MSPTVRLHQASLLRAANCHGEGRGEQRQGERGGSRAHWWRLPTGTAPAGVLLVSEAMLLHMACKQVVVWRGSWFSSKYKLISNFEDILINALVIVCSSYCDKCLLSCGKQKRILFTFFTFTLMVTSQNVDKCLKLVKSLT